MPARTLPQDGCRILERALSLEWIETNGRGGFSSGTVAGANTRRYHALLLTARKPPSERFVLVNHLEEWVDLNGQALPLSTNLYPGAVHPAGFERCTGFSIDPWPTWTYECNGATIRREIICVHGRDLTIVRWTMHGKKNQRARLRVRPKLTGRDYHATHHENGGLSPHAVIGEGTVSWQPYPDVPLIRAFHAGEYRHEPEWFRRIEYPAEEQRGLDHAEDWWSPGTFIFELEPDSAQTLTFTSEPVERLDVAALVGQEQARRDRLETAAPASDPLAGALWQAADAYLSQRGDRQTVIAGYPWFTDWGRDTFISLPGLCLVTGQHDVAWQVIAAFSEHISEGMVPNRFPDAGEQPEYNTIDASLWFIHAIDRYLVYSHDETRVRAVAWPAVKQIIDGYRRGTRYNIRMDADGLISGGVPGAQLTWMDAKVGDWVVTPRHGKPVEIQALWIRALSVGEGLARRFGESSYADRCESDRSRARASFRDRFWYKDGGHLYDVIDGPEGHDASIRPNQLYALMLCDDLVSQAQAQRVLDVVKEHLLTPVGLRTLSPLDHRYCPRYEGGVVQRDGAYHQGTVWPFLLGPFATAWLKVYGRSVSTIAEAKTFFDGLRVHVQDACLGQVSEIFDAEAPHHPRGCPAQAWSVAEPLRAMVEDLGYTAREHSMGTTRVLLRERRSPRPAPASRNRRVKSRLDAETQPEP